jgi:glycosyltransferase involved in cell wall biosynthesis
MDPLDVNAMLPTKSIPKPAPARPLRLLQVLGYAGVGGRRFGITGVERVVEILLEGLGPESFEHHVAYPRVGEMSDRYARHAAVLAIEPQRRYDRDYIAALVAHMRNHEIDLVLSHGMRFDFLTAVAARRVRVPHVVVRAVALADEPLPAWQRRVYGLADAWTLRRCERIIAVSEASRQRMLATQPLPAKKITVIPNGVRVPEVRRDAALRARQELGIAPETLVVGGVGQLIPRKAFDRLVEALAVLTPQFPAVTCVLVGEGPERERLTRLARERGVRLVLPGYRPDPYPALASFDVAVLPSLAEGMPLVVLEAMALGVSCVATPAAGTAELIEPEASGLLVPANDVPALASALQRLLEDPALRARFAAAGAGRVRDHYSLQAMLGRFESTLRDAAGWAP